MITAGSPVSSRAIVTQQVAALVEQSVHIVSVGVGQRVRKSDAVLLASENDNFIFINEYRDLKYTLDFIVSRICATAFTPILGHVENQLSELKVDWRNITASHPANTREDRALAEEVTLNFLLDIYRQQNSCLCCIALTLRALLLQEQPTRPC